jgi:hypothetical protein
MNFQLEDGSPGIPELVMTNGYMYFWLFSLSLAFCWCITLSFLIFRT